MTDAWATMKWIKALRIPNICGKHWSNKNNRKKNCKLYRRGKKELGVPPLNSENMWITKNNTAIRLCWKNHARCGSGVKNGSWNKVLQDRIHYSTVYNRNGLVWFGSFFSPALIFFEWRISKRFQMNAQHIILYSFRYVLREKFNH